MTAMKHQVFPQHHLAGNKKDSVELILSVLPNLHTSLGQCYTFFVILSVIIISKWWS